MSPYTLSDLLGYSSILCWLGAQFPQVLENIRLKSCEGLALPFLANWFLGDASNLLGCLLTHQLPFQTWLATYFVSVDILLVSQYFYYQGFKPSPSFGRARRGSISDRPGHYRTLSVVAANVSAAAALAAQQHDGNVRRSIDRLSASRVSDDADEFGAMADSFHSEGGITPTRKRVSWSTERYGKRGGSVGRAPLSRSTFLPRMTPTDQTADAVDRGRSLQREVDPAAESAPQSVSASADSNRRSSRASRRGANLVFLSLFALFGVGTWTGSRSGVLQGRSVNVGRVLTVPPVAFAPATGPHINHVHFVRSDDPPSHEPHHDPIPTDPSNERVLGRFFAWLCTTLYLTSRLPQIWKNFVRKSVEGLSMYLFIFAFLGNSFYVASILTSEQVFQPPPASSEFLRESLPYLLGSGGTLMFDVAIVSQSLIYRRAPRRHGKGRTLGEEESGLIAGDTLAHEPPRGRMSRTPSSAQSS
ncbi:PQ loop repeat-domain-containing protein [Mycena maculata]|uniref:PQ loop repeat-domain-containing protein n=1 Tax=Mycena maculata TaxID=230809 RepID=A0AAD7N0S0_9AGAR|nr:PQ loop repeat-domain-containing protein [Mycena maculata]